MTKRATALLVMIALCGLLPAAAQEPQQEMEANKAKQMADDAKGMAEKAENVADDAKAMAEKAEEMAGDAELKAEEMAAKPEMMAADLTLDEVLASHYEALGGIDTWKAIESVRFAGTMSMGPGMDAPFTMTMERPDRIRLEFTIQGMTGIQASDGETAWMLMPFMGQTEPQPMPEDQAEQLVEQADIEGPLFDWEAKGTQLELIGAEEMEGTKVYKLKLTKKNGEVRYHYLDSKSFVAIKQEGKTKVQGQEMDIETAIGGYEQVCLATSAVVDAETPCDGATLVLPYSIESKAKGAPVGQTITIESVAINPGDIEEGFFAMPAKKEAPAEESAAGG